MILDTVKIAISIEDGSVHVMSFITKGTGSSLPRGAKWSETNSGYWEREPNDENIFHEISRSYHSPDAPKPTGYKIITKDEIPADRTYRNAWKFCPVKKCIDHDIDKCKDIHLKRLKNERARKLTELDAEWMKHFSRGDTEAAQEVEKKRQAWRDMPVAISTDLDAATTPDELKKVTFEA